MAPVAKDWAFTFRVWGLPPCLHRNVAHVEGCQTACKVVDGSFTAQAISWDVHMLGLDYAHAVSLAQAGPSLSTKMQSRNYHPGPGKPEGAL